MAIASALSIRVLFPKYSKIEDEFWVVAVYDGTDSGLSRRDLKHIREIFDELFFAIVVIRSDASWRVHYEHYIGFISDRRRSFVFPWNEAKQYENEGQLTDMKNEKLANLG